MRTNLFAAAVTMLSTMEPTMALPLTANAGLDADVFAQVDKNFCRAYFGEMDGKFDELLEEVIEEKNWWEGHARKNYEAVESMLLYQKAIVDYYRANWEIKLSDAECDAEVERIDNAIDKIEWKAGYEPASAENITYIPISKAVIEKAKKVGPIAEADAECAKIPDDYLDFLNED